MSQNLPHDGDQPLLPPAEPDAEQNLWRWVLATVVVVVIVFVAFQAYRWLVTDVARRRAVAAGAAVSQPAGEGMVSESVQHDAQPAAPATPPWPATRANTTGEPPAPAVTGQAIHKCVDNGHVTYSNQPCPAGSDASELQASGTDENGVTGSAGDSAPATAAARPLNLGAADPGQRASVCGYLSAEISRLDYEFQQPLPPPVLDDISTQLTRLRTQARSAECAAPKPAAMAASAPAAPRRRPAPKLVDEGQNEQ